ncbi:TPA: hypothetical protein DCQ19_02040 [Candidatus Shapirobacteria bacterium]|nr:hypothetical protein [Candidatus Shapirobacteria bacterium]
MIDGQKMSKSIGNVISPSQLTDLFGVDGARYLIARSFPNENDSDVGIERFKERYNADLANNLGNLVSRLNKLNENLDIKFEKLDNKIDEKFDNLLNNLRFDEAIGYIFETYIDKANANLNQFTPWKLADEDPKKSEILADCIFNICLAANHLKAIMPESADKILDIFTQGHQVLEKPLFGRI